MRVAVLTLTRDRLDYTKHCFQQLHMLAGHPFDHYVLDNGSDDDTPRWLANTYRPKGLVTSTVNVGISRGLNTLLDLAGPDYDVIVKFDNDCELDSKNALRDCAALVHQHPGWLLSPRIHGLYSPPPISGETELDGHKVGITPLIGGIFLAANATVYQTYRPDEGNPIWGMDDVSICKHIQRKGGQVGYLLDHHANHYETTQGQERRYPLYFERKMAEFNA